jgi:hypothetical protein
LRELRRKTVRDAKDGSLWSVLENLKMSEMASLIYARCVDIKLSEQAKSMLVKENGIS